MTALLLVVAPISPRARNEGSMTDHVMSNSCYSESRYEDAWLYASNILSMLNTFSEHTRSVSEHNKPCRQFQRQHLLPESCWHHFRHHLQQTAVVTLGTATNIRPSCLHSLLTHVRKPVHLQSSCSDLRFVPKVNINIWTRAIAEGALVASICSVKSVENSAKFCHNLNTYLYNCDYPP